MSRRAQRVAEEIRSEVARILSSGLKDPRLGFVTVTRVSLTADLQHARVYVSVLGADAGREASLAVLRQAAGFVRGELGRGLRLRRTPELAFHHDPGIEATERVARLLETEAQTSPEDDGQDEGE